MTTPVTDWRGVEIQVGDRVIYPGRQGSHLWMVEAEVVEVVPGNPDAESYWDRVQHGLKVKRLRESRWKGDEIAQKIVPVQANHTTVVATAQDVERERYPLRYTVYNPNITVTSDLDENTIEIDGRAS